MKKCLFWIGLLFMLPVSLAPVTSGTYGFAIRKGDPDFLAWRNVFIAQIRSDGTLDLLTCRCGPTAKKPFGRRS